MATGPYRTCRPSPGRTYTSTAWFRFRRAPRLANHHPAATTATSRLASTPILACRRESTCPRTGVTLFNSDRVEDRYSEHSIATYTYRRQIFARAGSPHSTAFLASCLTSILQRATRTCGVAAPSKPTLSSSTTCAPSYRCGRTFRNA